MLSQQLVNQIQTLLFGKPIPEKVKIEVTFKDYTSYITVRGEKHTIKAIANQLSVDRSDKYYLTIESKDVDSLLSIAKQIKEELEQQGIEVTYEEDEWR